MNAIQVYDGDGTKTKSPSPRKTIPLEERLPPGRKQRLDCCCNTVGDLAYYISTVSRYYSVSRRQAVCAFGEDRVVQAETEALAGQRDSFHERDSRHAKIHHANPNRLAEKTWQQLYPWTVEEKLAEAKLYPDREMWKKEAT